MVEKTLAIINTRVSTAEQLQNNSLKRQLDSTLAAAKRLGAAIPEEGRWSGSVSSKAGTNVNRKDLLEMLEYCKRNRGVKYAIFDEYDRFMRSGLEGPYFEVLFQQLGVKVWFASESDAFNGDDAMAKLMRSMSAFKAEGSNEERQRKSVSGHKKAVRDGRYTFQLKAGYVKGMEAGMPLPHPKHFAPLQRALRDILGGIYTPQEALQRLNASVFGKSHAPWRMDKFRTFLMDPFYAGIIEIKGQVNERNENGLHKPMITKDEHYQLVEILTGSSKKRGPRKHYNPEFPMSNQMLFTDCDNLAKFTGSKKSNGYKKKTTRYYWKYRCRGCGREYHRRDVHSAVKDTLDSIKYTGQQKDDLIQALSGVWQDKQSDTLEAIDSTNSKITELKKQKSELVIQLSASEAQYRHDYEEAIDEVKSQIATLEDDLKKFDSTDEDMAEFIEFGLDYSSELKNDWWQLTPEDRKKCQELFFPGGISFGKEHKVSTHNLTAIYRLAVNEKEPRRAQYSRMVEMAGIAPASEK